jgi:hypothetical protein
MATSQSNNQPLSNESQQQIDQFNNALDAINTRIGELGNDLDENLAAKFRNAVVEARKLSEPLTDSKSITKELNKLMDKNEALLVKRKSLEENYAKALAKQANLSEKASQKQKDAADTAVELAKTKFNQARAEYLISQSLEDQHRKLLEIVEAEEELGRGKGLKSIEKTTEKMQGYFDNLGIGALFTFQSLLNAVYKLDNQITEMGKSLGISHESAKGLRDAMQEYSDASRDGFVTVERLVKAQTGLTEQLGIAVDFGNEERETFARLTEITGLSADEAGRLATFSAATGKSTRAYVSDLRVASMEASRANKIHISDKELLSSISKLSAGILVKFQGNPKALAQTVVEAKKLGLSLEQIDKIGESLLDFESSIESELEAELITGRKINLEKAREAALTGNQLDLTREIADQVGSLAEYQEMNVIAQGSLAKAFGLSRDEMSEMLMKQEAINKYGEEANKLNAEQLDYMERHGLSAEQMLYKVENQRSTQEKFNDLITKLEEKIAKLAEGPLGTLMNMFANIAESGFGIVAAITALGAISLSKTIASMAALAVQQGLAAAGALTWAAGITLGVGLIAVVAAIAAGMGAFSSAKQTAMKDGIMAPDGKVLYSGEAGSIKLNDNDTVIAGTNLGGGKKNIGDESSRDNSALIAAIDNLHSTMKTKSNDIYMDGQKVGTQVGRQTSTGTQQSMNSYRLA